MNYEEEQQNEVEALESIYFEELSVISASSPRKVLVNIKSQEQNVEWSVACNISFALPPTYPEVLPEIDICDTENFTEDDTTQLSEKLNQEASEDIGDVMLFQLISLSLEFLNDLADRKKLEVEEEIEQKAKEVEEAEKKRFYGTPVTVETFMSWKLKFDAERMKPGPKEKASQERQRKLTGREYFLQDKNIEEPEDGGAFLEGEVSGENFAIDEALFEDDLDDLTLDDDENDDELDDKDNESLAANTKNTAARGNKTTEIPVQKISGSR